MVVYPANTNLNDILPQDDMDDVPDTPYPDTEPPLPDAPATKRPTVLESTKGPTQVPSARPTTQPPTVMPTEKATEEPTAEASITTIVPTRFSAGSFFTTPDELRQAVVAYATDPGPGTAVAETYGWPIGTWYVFALCYSVLVSRSFCLTYETVQR